MIGGGFTQIGENSLILYGRILVIGNETRGVENNSGIQRAVRQEIQICFNSLYHIQYQIIIGFIKVNEFILGFPYSK